MDTIALSVRDLKKYFKVPDSEKHGFAHFARSMIGLEEYKVNKVIDGITFEVKKGECFGILGPNGTGKSTLMKMLAGIVLPDEGIITASGVVFPLLSLGVGFQKDLTAKDNVYQYGSILGLSDSQLKKKYNHIFRYAELQGFENLQLKYFSSGMRVRLAFSIAMEINPDILLLDEVLSVGDVAFRSKSKEKILEICNSGSTVIIVSHSAGTITDICDTAMFLKNGKIGMIGESSDVVDAYLDSMVSRLGPGELVLAQKRKEKIDRLRTERSDARIIADHFRITALHNLMNSVYNERICAGVDQFLSQKNLTKDSHLEEILAGKSGETHHFGEYWARLVHDVGEEARSRELAKELLNRTWEDGLIHFGDDDDMEFFPTDSKGNTLLIHKQLSIGTLISDSCVIPLVFDNQKRLRFTADAFQKTLHNVGYSAPTQSIIILPLNFTHQANIQSIVQNDELNILFQVPAKHIEEDVQCLDFIQSLESPEYLMRFDNLPLFVKEGIFDLYGHEMKGFGYFNPSFVSRDSNQFYRELYNIKESFGAYQRKTSLKPEVFIHEVAKQNGRYFSGTRKKKQIDVQANTESLVKRKSLFGITLLLIQGSHDPLACYRYYNFQSLTTQWFNQFIQIFTQHDQINRGLALLKLLNYTIQIWIEREKMNE